LQNLDTLIKQQASKLQGKVTILSLVEWLVEYSVHYEKPVNSLIGRDIDNDYTVVAQLDHIRSKTIYLKTLNQWFRELDLHGVLISYRKWIFLMVSGKKDSLQVLCVVQTKFDRSTNTLTLELVVSKTTQDAERRHRLGRKAL
jgi:hypothetical protein